MSPCSSGLPETEYHFMCAISPTGRKLSMLGKVNTSVPGNSERKKPGRQRGNRDEGSATRRKHEPKSSKQVDKLIKNVVKWFLSQSHRLSLCKTQAREKEKKEGKREIGGRRTLQRGKPDRGNIAFDATTARRGGSTTKTTSTPLQGGRKVGSFISFRLRN